MFQIVHKDVHNMKPVVRQALQHAIDREADHGALEIAKGLFSTMDSLRDAAENSKTVTVKWTLEFDIDAKMLLDAIDSLKKEKV